MSISEEEIYEFASAHHLAVVSTIGADGAPESALIYAVVTSDLDVIFYTLQTSRKCTNLRRKARISLVIGWPPDGERGANQDTLQYEGTAVELRDADREAAKRVYLEALPQNAGMTAWPGVTFFRVRPIWLRFSSYGKPWRVEELHFTGPRAAPGLH